MKPLPVEARPLGQCLDQRTPNIAQGFCHQEGRGGEAYLALPRAPSAGVWGIKFWLGTNRKYKYYILFFKKIYGGVAQKAMKAHKSSFS